MVIEMTIARWAPASESDAVELLAAATEPTRWRILATLASSGTRCACEIEPVANVAPNVLSYHLKVLREAGLVTSVRRGKWIDYSIAADASDRLARALPTALATALPCAPREVAGESCATPDRIAEATR